MKVPDDPDEVLNALSPIVSLIGKCAKARQNLKPGTWQHTMLGDNLKALNIASVLMNGKADPAEVPARAELQDALRALASMTSRTEAAQAAFIPGTSQHSLLRNRLRALRLAEARIQDRLDR